MGTQITLDKFHTPILQEIFSYLPVKSLVRCSSVCKRFKKIIDETASTQKKIGERFVAKHIPSKDSSGEKVVYSLERLFGWKKQQAETACNAKQSESWKIRSSFYEEICPRSVAETISSYPEHVIQQLAKYKAMPLVWYPVVFRENVETVKKILDQNLSSGHVLLPKEDLAFGQRWFIFHSDRRKEDDLKMFVEKGMKLTLEDLQSFVSKQGSYSLRNVIPFLIEHEAISVNKEMFMFLQAFYGLLDRGTKMLMEAGFPVAHEHLNPKNGFRTHKEGANWHYWDEKDVACLINGGLKIYDEDLSDALAQEIEHGNDINILNLMINAGALHPQGVDRAMDWLYQHNVNISNQQCCFTLKVADEKGLKLLIETNGMDLGKRKQYLEQIEEIAQKRGWSWILEKMYAVIQHPEEFLKLRELSAKFQSLRSPKEIADFLNKNKDFPLKEYHLSYALRFQYPKETVQLLLERGAPLKEFHLAVAMQWGCSREVFELLLTRIPPQIYHLNCALKHACPKEIIGLLMQTMKEKGVTFKPHQLSNVLHNAIELSSSDEILKMLIDFGAPVRDTHLQHMKDKNRHSPGFFISSIC